MLLLVQSEKPKEGLYGKKDGKSWKKGSGEYCKKAGRT